MITPLNWIKKFVPDLNVSDENFANKMTIFGTKVETYRKLNDRFNNVVVGKILSIEKHPDADRLVVCKVDIGNERIQIVTAAKNVYEGAVVPVVLPGGYVAGDGNESIKIKKGKLRGVESFGMFCSIHELGYNTDMFPEADDDGIYIFNDEVTIGDNVDKYLGLDDTVFEYEITSNRVDCFSIYGIAREAAAAFDLNLLEYKVKDYTNKSDKINDYISIEVRNSLCKRYCAKVVTDVKIEPSPKWLRQRLMSVGIRPINNIVDITNYIMEELGQPMHAFDLDKIEDKKLIIDTVYETEFKTLDGISRKIDNEILMINDNNKSLSIAGIMGGEDSKITDSSKNLLFESACFDGTNIRISSKKLGLRTDSSTKFEKGLDPNNVILAINKACELIEELGCGKVVEGIIDIHNELPAEKYIDFSVDKCNALLGTNISISDAKKYFNLLGLNCEAENKVVKVPTFRQDLNIFADLVEEIARSFGYDNIPTTVPKTANDGKLSEKIKIQNKVSEVLNRFGYDEIMTYSFEGKSVFEKLLLDNDDIRRKTVNILNPLGEEFSIMRTIPYNGILNSLKNNIKNRAVKACLYEFANTYIPTTDKLPDERLQICVANYNAGDFYDMKSVVEQIIKKLGLSKKIRYSTENKENYMHPGRQAKILYDDCVIGEIGELHPDVCENYDINKRVYISSLDYNNLMEFATSYTKYEKISKYPSIYRDLCFILDKNRSVIEIEDILDKYSSKYLSHYKLYDVYTGEKMGENKKSVTYNLVFASKDKTLTDEEINPIIDKLLKDLKNIEIELRQ